MRKQFFDMPFGTLLLARNISTVMLCALYSMLFAPCFPVEAQQSTKVPRIGYLTGARLTAIANRTEAFRQGLRELGYVEGKNILLNGGLLREISIAFLRLPPS